MAHISLYSSRSNIKRIQTLKNDIGHYFGRQLDRNLVIKKWKKKTILWQNETNENCEYNLKIC